MEGDLVEQERVLVVWALETTLPEMEHLMALAAAAERMKAMAVMVNLAL